MLPRDRSAGRKGNALIEAVTFDLDGTLIDSTDAIVNSVMHTFDEMGEERPTRRAIVEGIGHTLEDGFRQLGHSDPAEYVRIYRTHYAEAACAQTTLMPGAAESLARLREAGLKLAFATSKKRVYAEMILDHFGEVDQFVSRIGPDDVANPKPHPEPLLKSLTNLGVAAESMFFVGDTHFDVLAARAAGVRCLCVTTGYATRAELEALNPERVFDFLPELTAYILGRLD